MDLMMIAVYVVSIFLVLVLVKLIFKSMKTVVKVLINALIGGAIIWLLNILGVGITLNWITALLVGILGVPGVVVVLILQYVLHLI